MIHGETARLIPLKQRTRQHVISDLSVHYVEVSFSKRGEGPHVAAVDFAQAVTESACPSHCPLAKIPRTRLFRKGVAVDCGSDSTGGKIAVPLRRAPRL